MGVFDSFSDPLGILDFAKDNYAANRDYEHTREMFDSAQRFDERMSNTAYQRAVTDMESAGLNPMLAYQQGGASSPSQGAPAINRGSPTSGSLHTAAQVEQLRAQTDLTRAQAENVRVETEERRFNVDNLLPTQWATAQSEAHLRSMAEEINRETLSPEIAARKAEARLRQDGVPIELAKRAVELLLKRLDVPGARFRSRGYGMASKGLGGVKEVAEGIGDATGKIFNDTVNEMRGIKHGYERFKARAQYRRKYEFNRGD